MPPFLALSPITQAALIKTLCILVFFTLLFFGWDAIKPKDFLKPIKDRVKSWWVIFGVVIIIIGSRREVAFIVLALISFISFKELTSQLKINDLHRRTLRFAFIAIPLQFYFAYKAMFIPFLVFIPVAMMLLLPFRSLIEDQSEESLKTFSQLHWALMLTVFSLSHISYLMSLSPNSDESQGMIFFLILITQLNDVSQFIFGKLLGKKKVSPIVSPNKTWAGLMGGIGSSIVLGFFFRDLLPLNIVQVVVVSAMIAIFGFFGDLNISAIKRDLKIKDMSNLIPGHGGIMDRLDSLIFSNLIFFYLIYYWKYV